MNQYYNPDTKRYTPLGCATIGFCHDKMAADDLETLKGLMRGESAAEDDETVLEGQIERAAGRPSHESAMASDAASADLREKLRTGKIARPGTTFAGYGERPTAKPAVALDAKTVEALDERFPHLAHIRGGN